MEKLAVKSFIHSRIKFHLEFLRFVSISKGNSFKHERRRKRNFHHIYESCNGRRRIEHANKLSVKKNAAEQEERKENWKVRKEIESFWLRLATNLAQRPFAGCKFDL